MVTSKIAIISVSAAFLILTQTACGGSEDSSTPDSEQPTLGTPQPVVNTPPNINLSVNDITIEENSTRSVSYSASDDDGDDITISISDSPIITVSHTSNELQLRVGELDASTSQTLLISADDGQNVTTVSLAVNIVLQPESALLNLPETPFNYANTPLPDHFIQNRFPDNFQFQSAAIESDNTPIDNPITDAGATLGRVLFYDTILSANNSTSCASCHIQAHGFSDSRQLSIGFNGEETRRHSMGLANARFYQSGKFFWDERASSLEQQVLMPIQDEVEMGLALTELVEKISAQSYYPALFTQAFGDSQISSEHIAMALAQFVRAMVSTDAKYDLGRASVDNPLQAFPNFTQEENNGKRLFMTFRDGIPPCTSCHSSEAFVGPLIAPDSNATTLASNNGLDESSDEDLGVFESTGINGHTGKFKVPSLRNIAVRPPYMHDGRFASLEETIEHYSSGIKPHPTLQLLLKDDNGEPVRYNFTPQEQADLLAFLNTLTDESFLVDEKFSDPFLR
ncbi:cytochrome-c peroxidase [Shewanella nanhaiensis]|uniref:Cytochrome-c peroxidase n=1 Tax=Shewanella nanhaiensis TaxID=2864872 RepID=A0ABS7E1D5_9GAMM|nr:cytochrome c peroxidase [Shewanella nanhaiensis]MBW8183471.1 cytochrome-c peroxidase [Shewanella nanhaiensis]